MTPYNNYYGNQGTLRTPNRPAPAQSSTGFNRQDNKDTSRPLPDFDLANLSKELFDTIADNCAKTINDSTKDTVNQSTQIRRFYDELVMWNERAQDSDLAFKEALPFIYMIKSKVAYAKGRGTVDATFKDFINKTINQIDSRKTLNHAKLFMEAVMGFYKQYRTK